MSSSGKYIVSASARLSASPQRVYEVIADYHNGHPRILPRQFKKLTVERGGIGAGTVIRFNVKVFGRTQEFRAEITEPEPGRVLVERNLGPNESITTFTVDRGPTPHEANVTITTELAGSAGWRGTIERVVSTRVLKSMYRAELGKLEAVSRLPA